METKGTTGEETISYWFDLPIDVAEFEEKLGIGAESGDYRIIEKVLPFADEVHEHTSVYQLNELDFMYRQLSSDMQEKVGCEYISDLPSYKRKVWQEMKRLNPADYEERQLEDFSKYVFGMSYQTLQDVMKQQKGREKQCRKQGCWWKRKEQLAKKQYHTGSTCR